MWSFTGKAEEESLEKEQWPINLGLCGKAVKEYKYNYVRNPKQNCDYNEIVDLPSNLPLLTIPVIQENFNKLTQTNNKSCRAVF